MDEPLIESYLKINPTIKLDWNKTYFLPPKFNHTFKFYALSNLVIFYESKNDEEFLISSLVLHASSNLHNNPKDYELTISIKYPNKVIFFIVKTTYAQCDQMFLVLPDLTILNLPFQFINHSTEIIFKNKSVYDVKQKKTLFKSNDLYAWLIKENDKYIFVDLINSNIHYFDLLVDSTKKSSHKIIKNQLSIDYRDKFYYSCFDELNQNYIIESCFSEFKSGKHYLISHDDLGLDAIIIKNLRVFKLESLIGYVFNKPFYATPLKKSDGENCMIIVNVKYGINSNYNGCYITNNGHLMFQGKSGDDYLIKSFDNIIKFYKRQSIKYIYFNSNDKPWCYIGSSNDGKHQSVMNVGYTKTWFLCSLLL